ncbi:hypothetical protein HYU13_05530 [Candidatus Woesearchaeota archaeon]|nr:hypothetical protein [Candidatus Woesearchaeota archaeon]
MSGMNYAWGGPYGDRLRRRFEQWKYVEIEPSKNRNPPWEDPDSLCILPVNSFLTMLYSQKAYQTAKVAEEGHIVDIEAGNTNTLELLIGAPLEDGLEDSALRGIPPSLSSQWAKSDYRNDLRVYQVSDGQERMIVAVSGDERSGFTNRIWVLPVHSFLMPSNKKEGH